MRPFPRLIAAALAAATAALAVSAPSHRRPAAPLQQLASTSPAGALLAPSDRLAAAEQNFRGATGPVAQLVALYRAEDIFQLLSPRQVLAGLDRFAAAPNVAPLVQAEIANQRAAAQLRAGDAAAATALWQKLGVVTHWRGVGPFDNSSPSAIATPQGPENSINFTAEYQGKQHSVRWRTVPYSATRGELELSSYFSPAQSASAYLVSWVRSPAAQSVALRLRDSGSTRLWVNGHLAFDEQGVHSTRGFDQHAAGAHLAAGWNEILAKVGDSETADWLFSLRITTPEGAPLALESTAAAPATVAPHAAASAAPVAVTDLAAIAKSAASTGEGELNYAWILARKQNFNAGDHSDANAFMSAIASLPNDAQAVLDFAEHDSDTSRIYQNLETLLAKSPGVPHAHELLGMIELARNEYWPARADLLQSLGLPAGETSPASIPAAAVARAPMAALGLLEVNAGMGIRPQVLAWAEALKAAGATTAAVAAPVSATLRRMGAAQDSLAWIGLAHASDQGNVGISVALADAQRRAGDLNAALATLQQAIALNGELPNLQETLARALTGLNRQPEALAAIAQAVTLAPDNPEYHLAQGELERHFGHATSGLDAWQTALNLNPQDNDLRDRLKLARGSEGTVEASFELPYTQDLQHAIANYQTAVKADTNGTLQSGPVVILADSTVINIFPSGNNGRYVQQIFRINNSTGADALAVYSVTYDPATEDVRFLTAHVLHADGSSADAPEAGDQPISQSVGYETFYNVRNKYVEMPPMRPGDFVEIAYRVLPTTLESLYGDYYGDIQPFGSSAATLFQQYVVITPANKNLYYKAIRFPGAAEVKQSNGEKIYRWSAANLPAQVGEPSAPPSIEQSPYIAVSAFQTWDQFGRWYTQLIRDTFVMDDEMVRTVNGLIKGKTTEADKVDAIYRWVIQNTHYVALEFGIHGYRPYPVTQVFHRRFGDCKDKASLLIAMLHQAGISAQIVLVRIRDLGVIDSTIPSVADFDHAIVYVPSMHRYLDGTAEYNGADELPAGDQRAFVLRLPVDADLSDPPGDPVPAVNTAPVAPVVTPDQPAAANVVSRVLNGQLDAQGNLRFQMSWSVSGEQAPLFRQALELPDRQAGAIQAMLHTRLPGISVTHVVVTNDDDWDQPISINLEGTIPRFAAVNGSTLLIPRQILPKAWLPEMASLGQRQYPVLSSPPQILQEETHLALPPGYQLGALPPPTQLQQPFATFQSDANLNGGTLTLRSRIETKQSLIPVADYAGFRNFWAQVDATLSRPIASRPAAAAGQGGQQ